MLGKTKARIEQVKDRAKKFAALTLHLKWNDLPFVLARLQQENEEWWSEKADTLDVLDKLKLAIQDEQRRPFFLDGIGWEAMGRDAAAQGSPPSGDLLDPCSLEELQESSKQPEQVPETQQSQPDTRVLVTDSSSNGQTPEIGNSFQGAQTYHLPVGHYRKSHAS